MLTKLADYLLAALLKYLGKVIPQMLKDYSDKRKLEREQAEAKKELDSVVGNPNSTAEERARAYEKFVNSSH